MIIYCDGDSWTAGDIVDPELFGDDLTKVNDPLNTPYRLSKVWPGMLDYETINESEAGSSNDAIVRRAYRNVLNLLKENKPEDLFVIIGWSSPERKDFYYHGKHTSWETLYPAQFEQDFNFHDKAAEKELQKFYKIYLKYFWNQEEYLERYIQQNLSLHHFLLNKGIKHLFFDAFFESKENGLWGDEELLDHLSDSDTIQEEFIKLREEFFIPISMKQYLLNTDHEFMWDGHHPSEQGHKYWSNKINKILKSVI